MWYSGDSLQSDDQYGAVCQKCWLKVDIFHNFYQQIEHIHRPTEQNEEVYEHIFVQSLKELPDGNLPLPDGTDIAIIEEPTPLKLEIIDTLTKSLAIHSTLSDGMLPFRITEPKLRTATPTRKNTNSSNQWVFSDRMCWNVMIFDMIFVFSDVQIAANVFSLYTNWKCTSKNTTSSWNSNAQKITVMRVSQPKQYLCGISKRNTQRWNVNNAIKKSVNHIWRSIFAVCTRWKIKLCAICVERFRIRKRRITCITLRNILIKMVFNAIFVKHGKRHLHSYSSQKRTTLGDEYLLIFFRVSTGTKTNSQFECTSCTDTSRNR